MKFKVGDRIKAKNIDPTRRWPLSNVPEGTIGTIEKTKVYASGYYIIWDTEHEGRRTYMREYELEATAPAHSFKVGDTVRYKEGKEKMAPGGYTKAGMTFTIKCKDSSNRVFLFDKKDYVGGTPCGCGSHSWSASPGDDGTYHIELVQAKANRFAKGKWLVDCETQKEWESLCDELGVSEKKHFWSHAKQHGTGLTCQIINGRFTSYCHATYDGWSSWNYADYTRVPFKSSEAMATYWLGKQILRAYDPGKVLRVPSSGVIGYSAPSITPSINWFDELSGDLIEIKPKKSFMSSILDFAKNAVLSADEKLLRKQNLKDTCGDYTNTAWELVKQKLMKDNEEYLVATAKAKDEEDKANK